MGVLGAVVLTVIAGLYRALVAVALDEEGARVSGVPVGALNVTLAAVAAVTVAISMRIVGILLVAALMVLPVIAAGRIAWSVRSTIFIAMGIGLGSAVVGLTIAYYANLAPGGTIVLTAAGAAVLASVASSVGKTSGRQGPPLRGPCATRPAMQPGALPLSRPGRHRLRPPGRTR